MKVLLISTNRLHGGMPPFPLGVACVAAGLTSAGHQVEIWDAMFEADWSQALTARLAAFSPEAIGFSIRNVDDQNPRAPVFFLDEIRGMVALCRERSSAVLVGGGAGFSIFPEAILEYLDLDYGVAGEGEQAFPALLEALAEGRSPAGVPGAVWRDHGRVTMALPDWSVPLDALPPVHRQNLDLARYYGATGSADRPNPITVQSKRGCPLRCAYCSTFAVEGCRIRCREPRQVVDELEWLQGQGYERLHFVDSVFTNPAWHARAICDELLRRRLEVRWSATVSPGQVEPDLLRLMRRAGCVLLLLGNEHTEARMLQTP
ncbi:MAG: cobalamin-dependent protein, partial [Candidatus Latescibacterota bacterium]